LLSRTRKPYHLIVALLGIEPAVCNDNVATAPMWASTKDTAAGTGMRWAA
jgi:hypothetical protein